LHLGIYGDRKTYLAETLWFWFGLLQYDLVLLCLCTCTDCCFDVAFLGVFYSYESL